MVAAAITVADAVVVVVTAEAVVTVMAANATAITRIGAALRECRDEISVTGQWAGLLAKSRLRGVWSIQIL